MEGRRRDVGGQQRAKGEQQIAGGAGELVVREAIVAVIAVVIVIAVVVAVVVTLVVPAAGRRGVGVPGLGHQVHRPQAAVAGGQQHGGREDEEDVDEAPHRGRV
jgi:hypothetical protein